LKDGKGYGDSDYLMWVQWQIKKMGRIIQNSNKEIQHSLE